MELVIKAGTLMPVEKMKLVEIEQSTLNKIKLPYVGVPLAKKPRFFTGAAIYFHAFLNDEKGTNDIYVGTARVYVPAHMASKFNHSEMCKRRDLFATLFEYIMLKADDEVYNRLEKLVEKKNPSYMLDGKSYRVHIYGYIDVYYYNRDRLVGAYRFGALGHPCVEAAGWRMDDLTRVQVVFDPGIANLMQLDSEVSQLTCIVDATNELVDNRIVIRHDGKIDANWHVHSVLVGAEPVLLPAFLYDAMFVITDDGKRKVVPKVLKELKDRRASEELVSMNAIIYSSFLANYDVAVVSGGFGEFSTTNRVAYFRGQNSAYRFSIETRVNDTVHFYLGAQVLSKDDLFEQEAIDTYDEFVQRYAEIGNELYQELTHSSAMLFAGLKKRGKFVDIDMLILHRVVATWYGFDNRRVKAHRSTPVYRAKGTLISVKKNADIVGAKRYMPKQDVFVSGAYMFRYEADTLRPTYLPVVFKFPGFSVYSLNGELICTRVPEAFRVKEYAKFVLQAKARDKDDVGYSPVFFDGYTTLGVTLVFVPNDENALDLLEANEPGELGTYRVVELSIGHVMASAFERILVTETVGKPVPLYESHSLAGQINLSEKFVRYKRASLPVDMLLAAMAKKLA